MSRPFSQELDRILSHVRCTQTPMNDEGDDANNIDCDVGRDIEHDIECAIERGKDARAYAFSLAFSYGRIAVASFAVWFVRRLRTKNKI